MHLTNLTLSNYRCFESLDIDFAKITLILGPNSGGKTAVMTALLSAIQTDHFPLYLSPNGEFVETGDFREIVFGHSTATTISVELEYGGLEDAKDGRARVKGAFEFDPKTKMPRLTNCKVSGKSVDLIATKSRARYKFSWNYVQERDSRTGIDKELPEFAAFLEKLHSTSIAAKSASSSGKSRKGGVSSSPVEAPLSTFPAAFVFKDPWTTIGVAEAVSTSKKFKPSFRYLGSHRAAPLRTYFHTVGSDLRVGSAGQNAVEQILDWNIQGSGKLTDLVRVLKNVGLARNMRAAKLAGGRVELRVTTASKRPGSSIADVGFGVNQFLPIAVAELQLPKGSTVAISQPETHLHPSAQAAVGEHFANQVKLRDFRYVIETHSEYMVNRIRRLIAAGKLDETDVAAYYIAPSGRSSISKKMVFKKTGEIEGAPKEFFETYQVDVLGIAIGE